MSLNNIDEESRLLDEMVLCAKRNKFERVFQILGPPGNPSKPYLLNSIPQSRRWGVMHQAVYRKGPDNLQKLLTYPGCDVDIKAKKCMSDIGFTGRMTPLELAVEYKYTELADMIREYQDMNTNAIDIQTFRSIDSYTSDRRPCLLKITIAAYKTAFHPRHIDRSKPLFELLLDIYNDIDGHPDRWKDVRDVVADSVYTVNTAKAEILIKCDSKYDFFSQVVNCYTNENNSIYAFLNVAFRRQTDSHYLPSAQDLAVGPYCLMYQMLLLFWPELKPDARTTYRQMLMRQSDVAWYAPGIEFVWPAVVSSAVNEDHVHAFPTLAGAPTGDMVVLFTIDNSAQSHWQPRNIEKHAEFPESERTYPAGAKFEIKDREDRDDGIFINLKLLE